MTQDVMFCIALALVAVGFFCAGRTWEMSARKTREENERTHNIIAGSHYVLDRYQGPFDSQVKVQVLCIKDGWVQYLFTDAPNSRPDSKTIREFCAIYKPAVESYCAPSTDKS